MTKEIKFFLENIKNHTLFDTDTLFFIGGTALSFYLNHRVSYDVDIASTSKLDISNIRSFAFSIGAREIKDKNASAFRINSGEDIENYHLRFYCEGVKLEFSHFRSPIQKSILENASFTPYSENSKLKILDLKDIVSLKIYALFNRQKTRDLFDASIILEKDLLSLKELERIYSYTAQDNLSVRDYISNFKAADDEADNSLDFLPEHKHYRAFAKKNQKERFIEAKTMLLDRYTEKQKEALKTIKKNAIMLKKST